MAIMMNTKTRSGYLSLSCNIFPHEQGAQRCSPLPWEVLTPIRFLMMNVFDDVNRAAVYAHFHPVRYLLGKGAALTILLKHAFFTAARALPIVIQSGCAAISDSLAEGSRASSSVLTI